MKSIHDKREFSSNSNIKNFNQYQGIKNQPNINNINSTRQNVINPPMQRTKTEKNEKRVNGAFMTIGNN
jgi:hypothetical protein